MSDSEASAYDEHEKKKLSETLHNYIRSLTHQDIIKILSPVKAQLISEDTVLCFDRLNLSAEHIELKFTVRDFLEILGTKWQKWIHSAGEIEEHYHYHQTADISDHVRYGGFDGGFDEVDIPPVDFVSDFISKLTKHQKRAILMLARDGLLTDESFLNVAIYTGPDRIQVSMKKTVDIIGTLRTEETRNVLQKYVDIQNQSLWLSLGIVVIASLLISVLMYLVTYMVGFLFCCESNLQPLSTHPISDMNRIQRHFYEIHHFEYRIYATRIIQFILLWYTMLLAIYAHEYDLNVYPALSCVLSNGFGLMLFMRITHFLHSCRKGNDQESAKVLFAR
ncbi:hypothetical protein M3Y97_00850700 [Aphelenchoides bicaudatus]|nr:hypothetical protein M3Y97_00850700 [Aphelenchoides bicaudatus]